MDDELLRRGPDHSWGRVMVGVISETEEEHAKGIEGLELHFLRANEAKGHRSDARRLIIEEVFKFMTRFGWAQAYPEKLRVSDFGGFHGQQMALLQCVDPGWKHPDNICPDGLSRFPGLPAALPLQGKCSSASCDVVEFFY